MGNPTPLESAEDRLALLQSTGELVEVNGAKVYGLFEAPYFSYPDGAIGVESSNPRILFRDEDSKYFKRGDIVRIRESEDWIITGTEPDYIGMAWFLLELSENRKTA